MLPDKKASGTIEYIIVDVTESPIQRPKKGQKEYYSGKKTSYNKDPSDYRKANKNHH